MWCHLLNIIYVIHICRLQIYASDSPDTIGRDDRILSDLGPTAADIRSAIWVVYWNVLNSPTPDEWAGKDGSINYILKHLNMPKGSYGTVLAVLKLIDKGVEAGVVPDLDRKPGSGASNRVIEPGSVEATIIMECMEKGYGINTTTLFVNEHRVKTNQSHIQSGAVYTCHQSMRPKNVPYGTRKQGSSDAHGNWSRARYFWSAHWLARMNLLTAEEKAIFAADAERVLPDFLDHEKIKAAGFDFTFDNTVHWDETHMEVYRSMNIKLIKHTY